MNTNAPSFSKLSRAALRLTGATRLLAALGGLAGAPAILEAQLNITRQPTQVVVTSGQTASFSVGVTANPEPTYQWRRFGQPIAGATAASYQIPQARQFDNDFYDVEIQSGTTTALSQSARLIVAPPSYPGALTLDLARSWRLEGPENSTIYSPTFGQAVLPDGRFYLSGRFSNVNGQARPHLARFNANGTVDTSFTPPSFDAQPIHLALQPDGKLLVGGIFKTVGGAPAGHHVRRPARRGRPWPGPRTLRRHAAQRAGGRGGRLHLVVTSARFASRRALLYRASLGPRRRTLALRWPSPNFPGAFR